MADKDIESTEVVIIEAKPVVRPTFVDLLQSPVIEITVGSGQDKATLHAHEAILSMVPYFAKHFATLKENDSRTIAFPQEDAVTVGSAIEFIYHGDYIPRRFMTGSQESPLETDPTVPQPDFLGVGLLKHAKICLFAKKIGLMTLKALARTKIQYTPSTTKGEIEFARFIYKNTALDDQELSKNVASFWAGSSQVLRNEAREEFRSLCLDCPHFAYDVLLLVLDQKEKQIGKNPNTAELSIFLPGTPEPGNKRRRKA